MDLYIDDILVGRLNKSVPTNNSFVFETDTNYYSTFSLISEECPFNDIYLNYNDEIYYLGSKRNTKKNKDIRMFDINIKHVNTPVSKAEPNNDNLARLKVIKMLFEHKDDITSNLNNKGPSHLENVSNITQLLMLGEVTVSSIIQTFNYFFTSVDPAMLSYIIDSMENTEQLEKLLYEKYTKIHVEVIKRRK